MSTFLCSASNPCRSDLCCGADGYCSKSADSCNVNTGCISGCKNVPSPASCSTYKDAPSNVFKSALFPTLSATASIPMQVAPYRSSSAGACAQSLTYALKPCDLVDMMGGPSACPNCLFYYDYVREAAEMYDMAGLDCNANGIGATRLADFLAQVKHETASLRVLFQPADNGAGAIHMIPAHFAAAINGIPRLKAGFANDPAYNSVNQLSQSDLESALDNNSTLQRQVGLFIQRPENAFLTAAWWYIQGAQTRLDPSCGDLRIPADQGLGSTGGPTGYYKVSQCIYGSLSDPGLNDRVAAYQNAISYGSLFSATYTRSGLTPPSGSQGPASTIGGGGTGSGSDPGLVAGVIIAVLLAVGLVIAFFMRRRRSWHVGSLKLPCYAERKPAANVPLFASAKPQGPAAMAILSSAAGISEKVRGPTAEMDLAKPSALSLVSASTGHAAGPPARRGSDNKAAAKTPSTERLDNLPKRAMRSISKSRRGSRVGSSNSLRELAARNSIMKASESSTSAVSLVAQSQQPPETTVAIDDDAEYGGEEAQPSAPTRPEDEHDDPAAPSLPLPLSTRGIH